MDQPEITNEICKQKGNEFINIDNINSEKKQLTTILQKLNEILFNNKGKIEKNDLTFVIDGVLTVDNYKDKLGSLLEPNYVDFIKFLTYALDVSEDNKKLQLLLSKVETEEKKHALLDILVSEHSIKDGGSYPNVQFNISNNFDLTYPLIKLKNEGNKLYLSFYLNTTSHRQNFRTKIMVNLCNFDKKKSCFKDKECKKCYITDESTKCVSMNVSERDGHILPLIARINKLKNFKHDDIEVSDDLTFTYKRFYTPEIATYINTLYQTYILDREKAKANKFILLDQSHGDLEFKLNIDTFEKKLKSDITKIKKSKLDSMSSIVNNGDFVKEFFNFFGFNKDIIGKTNPVNDENYINFVNEMSKNYTDYFWTINQKYAGLTFTDNKGSILFPTAKISEEISKSNTNLNFTKHDIEIGNFTPTSVKALSAEGIWSAVLPTGSLLENISNSMLGKYDDSTFSKLTKDHINYQLGNLIMDRKGLCEIGKSSIGNIYSKLNSNIQKEKTNILNNNRLIEELKDDFKEKHQKIVTIDDLNSKLDDNYNELVSKNKNIFKAKMLVSIGLFMGAGTIVGLTAGAATPLLPIVGNAALQSLGTTLFQGGIAMYATQSILSKDGWLAYKQNKDVVKIVASDGLSIHNEVLRIKLAELCTIAEDLDISLETYILFLDYIMVNKPGLLQDNSFSLSYYKCAEEIFRSIKEIRSFLFFKDIRMTGLNLPKESWKTKKEFTGLNSTQTKSLKQIYFIITDLNNIIDRIKSASIGCSRYINDLHILYNFTCSKMGKENKKFSSIDSFKSILANYGLDFDINNEYNFYRIDEGKLTRFKPLTLSISKIFENYSSPKIIIENLMDDCREILSEEISGEQDVIKNYENKLELFKFDEQEQVSKKIIDNINSAFTSIVKIYNMNEIPDNDDLNFEYLIKRFNNLVKQDDNFEMFNNEMFFFKYKTEEMLDIENDYEDYKIKESNLKKLNVIFKDGKCLVQSEQHDIFDINDEIVKVNGNDINETHIVNNIINITDYNQYDTIVTDIDVTLSTLKYTEFSDPIVFSFNSVDIQKSNFNIVEKTESLVSNVFVNNAELKGIILEKLENRLITESYDLRKKDDNIFNNFNQTPRISLSIDGKLINSQTDMDNIFDSYSKNNIEIIYKKYTKSDEQFGGGFIKSLKNASRRIFIDFPMALLNYGAVKPGKFLYNTGKTVVKKGLDAATMINYKIEGKYNEFRINDNYNYNSPKIFYFYLALHSREQLEELKKTIYNYHYLSKKQKINDIRLINELIQLNINYDKINLDKSPLYQLFNISDSKNYNIFYDEERNTSAYFILSNLLMTGNLYTIDLEHKGGFSVKPWGFKSESIFTKRFLIPDDKTEELLRAYKVSGSCSRASTTSKTIKQYHRSAKDQNDNEFLHSIIINIDSSPNAHILKWPRRVTFERYQQYNNKYIKHLENFNINEVFFLRYLSDVEYSKDEHYIYNSYEHPTEKLIILLQKLKKTLNQIFKEGNWLDNLKELTKAQGNNDKKNEIYYCKFLFTFSWKDYINILNYNSTGQLKTIYDFITNTKKDDTSNYTSCSENIIIKNSATYLSHDPNNYRFVKKLIDENKDNFIKYKNSLINKCLEDLISNNDKYTYINKFKEFLRISYSNLSYLESKVLFQNNINKIVLKSNYAKRFYRINDKLELIRKEFPLDYYEKFDNTCLVFFLSNLGKIITCENIDSCKKYYQNLYTDSGNKELAKYMKITETELNKKTNKVFKDIMDEYEISPRTQIVKNKLVNDITKVKEAIEKSSTSSEKNKLKEELLNLLRIDRYETMMDQYIEILQTKAKFDEFTDVDINKLNRLSIDVKKYKLDFAILEYIKSKIEEMNRFEAENGRSISTEQKILFLNKILMNHFSFDYESIDFNMSELNKHQDEENKTINSANVELKEYDISFFDMLSQIKAKLDKVKRKQMASEALEYRGDEMTLLEYLKTQPAEGPPSPGKQLSTNQVKPKSKSNFIGTIGNSFRNIGKAFKKQPKVDVNLLEEDDIMNPRFYPKTSYKPGSTRSTKSQTTAVGGYRSMSIRRARKQKSKLRNKNIFSVRINKSVSQRKQSQNKSHRKQQNRNVIQQRKRHQPRSHRRNLKLVKRNLNLSNRRNQNKSQKMNKKYV